MSVELLTVHEIADILKLSKRHVQDRVVHQASFPEPYVIGGSRRWDKKDLFEWLSKQKKPKTGRPRK